MKSRNVTSWIVSFLLVGSLIYLFTPTLNFRFFGIWICSIIFFIGPIATRIIGEEYQDEYSKFTLHLSEFFLGIIGLCIISYMVSTLALFHSAEYKNILSEVQTSNFTKDIAQVDPNQVRVVDQLMAEKLGDKKIGQDPGLGSRVELGDFNIQQVGGKLYWVAPLLHNGFFRWWNFGDEGTNGYIQVSATNPDDVKLVQEVSGKKIQIVYQPNAFFSQDLERHIYMNGYASKGLTDMSFEIDERGNPWWVVTVYERKIGFSGEDAIGVVIVNPKNGELKFFDIASAPKWIDRIQPENFIIDQITWWGEYINGFWNALFAKKDVLQPSSKELRLVFGEDGKSYWYSGITSTGKDSSNVGFLLVNTRTKETFRYAVSGATEAAAESSAEGMVQQFKYKASNFIPYNVAGYVTYIGALKDAEGLIKGVAAVNMENYGIGGWGKNVSEAIRTYKQNLVSRNNSSSIGKSADKKIASGIITRIASDTKNGNTSYFFTMEGFDGYIFTGSSDMNQKIPLTQKGDKVEIKFTFSGNFLVDIDAFNNLDINLNNNEK